MKKKKNRYGIRILITLFIVVISGAYVYSRYSESKNVVSEHIPGLNKKNEPEASKLYNRIMSYDLVTVYPQTPEEVMRLYNDTVHLMYGDMISDSDLMKDVLAQQRRLCSAELLNDLGIDEQFMNLQAALGILKEQGSICVSVEDKSVKYDSEDKNRCIISVKNTYTGGNTVYRNYILYKNETKSRWEVYSWEQTDEYFNSKVFE